MGWLRLSLAEAETGNTHLRTSQNSTLFSPNDVEYVLKVPLLSIYVTNLWIKRMSGLTLSPPAASLSNLWTSESSYCREIRILHGILDGLMKIKT